MTTPKVEDEVQIRPVGDADWARIWPILSLVARAQETYALDPDLTEADGAALWLESPPGLSIVAVADGDVVGSAKMGPNRPGPGRHIATASFIVSPAAQGRGVGRALGEWVIAWCARQGFHGIQFNAVVETNTAAVRLWHRLGFVTVGTVPEAFDHPAHGLVGLEVMYRPLP
jgi:GNAT superfamily N-acetyltransferase